MALSHLGFEPLLHQREELKDRIFIQCNVYVMHLQDVMYFKRKRDEANEGNDVPIVPS